MPARAPRPTLGSLSVRQSFSGLSRHHRARQSAALRRRVASQASFTQAETQALQKDEQPVALPAKSGVYAVFSSEEKLQYVGISRNLKVSVDNHLQKLGDGKVHAVKVDTLDNATKEELQIKWKSWLQEAVDSTGDIPPGNAGEEKEQWQPQAAKKAKPEIKLTAGKGADDVTVSIQELIGMVVKNEPVVAFIKGTRTQPQCGFSYQMLETLNNLKADYQLVNVLDEQYNPGVREGIKAFSAWPTIPQLYVKGEFVGGNDIVQEMAQSGELAKLVQQEQKQPAAA